MPCFISTAGAGGSGGGGYGWDSGWGSQTAAGTYANPFFQAFGCGGGTSTTASTASATSTTSTITFIGTTTGSTVSDWFQAQQLARMHAGQHYLAAQARQETAEQRAAREERTRLIAEEARAARQAEDERRNAALDRAQQLLLEHLTPEQRDTVRTLKWFIVMGGRTRTKYRIHTDRSYSANIHVLDGEAVKHRLCGHIRDGVPLPDHLLAQKLMLEHDEDEFLKLARRHAA